MMKYVKKYESFIYEKGDFKKSTDFDFDVDDKCIIINDNDLVDKIKNLVKNHGDKGSLAFEKRLGNSKSNVCEIWNGSQFHFYYMYKSIKIEFNEFKIQDDDVIVSSDAYDSFNEDGSLNVKKWEILRNYFLEIDDSFFEAKKMGLL